MIIKQLNQSSKIKQENLIPGEEALILVIDKTRQDNLFTQLSFTHVFLTGLTIMKKIRNSGK